MSTDRSNHPQSSCSLLPTRYFAYAMLLALCVEFLLITGVGWQKHWLAHPPESNPEAQFLEAEVFEVPSNAHLVSIQKSHPPVSPTQALNLQPKTLSAPSATLPGTEENVVHSGPTIASSHGPIAVYAPSPVLPLYLQHKAFKSHVIIDFYVYAHGAVIPRLVRSSGQEELDALALQAVKQWQFRPAEKDHQPIDSKVRLRIVFEVR